MKRTHIKLRYRLIGSLSFLAIAATGLADAGTIEKPQFYSKALEGNLLGDSPMREVFVYLPPSYKTKKAKLYPVVYLLHGNSPSNSMPEHNPAVRWAADLNKPPGRYNQ